MIKDSIKSSLEDIQTLHSTDKDGLTHFSNIALKSLKKEKGKANNLTIVLDNKDGYIIELTEKRIRSYTNKTAEEKLKAIGLIESNESKLIEKINKGELNNNHIANIRSADIGDALIQLPAEIQEKVIDTIIVNTNERHQINREELASESIKVGNIDLVLIENWYKGILRSANQFESKLYINNEMLELLSKAQQQYLYEVINKITIKCNDFMGSL